MVGGIVTSTIMELAVYPAIYFIWRSRQMKRRAHDLPSLAQHLILCPVKPPSPS